MIFTVFYIFLFNVLQPLVYIFNYSYYENLVLKWVVYNCYGDSCGYSQSELNKLYEGPTLEIFDYYALIGNTL